VVPRVGSKGATDLCVSQYFNKLSKEQMNQFMVGLTLAEPAVVGSCDGACWMRQVSSGRGVCMYAERLRLTLALPAPVCLGQPGCSMLCGFKQGLRSCYSPSLPASS
jgi:hypothetical protein